MGTETTATSHARMHGTHTGTFAGLRPTGITVAVQTFSQR